MAQITDTITDIQSQVLDVLDKVEAPVVDIVKQAAEKVADVLPEDRPELPYVDQLPTPAELVELGFGFAQKLLDNQHEFVKALVAAAGPLLPQPAKPVAKPKAAPKAA